MNTWTQLRKDAVPLAKSTWEDFQKHNGQWLAAALAYFTAFAIAPLIIVIVEIAGLAIGNHQRALDAIFTYLQRDAGAGAGAVKQIVSSTFNEPRRGVLAEIIGWIIFALASIGLFNAVQFALNHVWDLTPVKMSIWKAIRQRLSAFAVMMSIALLLLISIALNAVLTIAGGYLTHVFVGFATLLKIADFVISVGVIWLGFAVLFKYLPECDIEWKDVWAGAGLTALLFVIGQFLLGWYLGRAGISSGYGAFGSFVVFLIWVNYSAQIMLLGAEFTHVYAQRHGSQSRSSTTRGEIKTKYAGAQP